MYLRYVLNARFLWMSNDLLSSEQMVDSLFLSQPDTCWYRPILNSSPRHQPRFASREASINLSIVCVVDRCRLRLALPLEFYNTCSSWFLQAAGRQPNLHS